MSGHKVIGYFAYFSKQAVFCDGDACIIAGSEQKMIEYLSKKDKQKAAKYTIRKTRFEEIMTGISLGAAYCFDEELYNRFYPLVRDQGLNIGAEDFSEERPTGTHLVRIQRILCVEK